jgi:hypothetical protein
MSWTMGHFVSESLVRHVGRSPFLVLGGPFEPVLRGMAVLLAFYWILLWMFRKGIFVKI